MPPAMTAATSPLHGVCPVLATPFDASGAPDEAGLARVVDFALESGVDAVVFPGVASEVEQLSAARPISPLARGTCAWPPMSALPRRW